MKIKILLPPDPGKPEEEQKEKEYRITMDMAKAILVQGEVAGMLGDIMKLSQRNEEDVDEEFMKEVLGTFVKYFDIVEFVFETITHGEVNAGDMDVDVAVMQTMAIVQQFVAPLRYALSPDHLSFLKKNTSLEKAGEVSAGKLA